MSDYTRAAIDSAAKHAKFSSYDVMREAVDAELVKVAAAVNSKQDDPSDQTLTASGAVTPGVSYLALNNTTTAIAATIADAAAHAGILVVETVSEPGAGQDHTVTLTAGTWNGTNTVATFADNADQLVVFFNAAGRGRIVLNTGSVALSGP